MKQFFQTITLAISVLFFTHTVVAQCPTCDAALAKDTRDYYHTELKTDFKDVLTEIFSHDFSYYKSGAWKSNSNFQSGGSYGVISGFLDGSKTDEQNEQTFTTEKNSFNLNHDISKSVYLNVSQSIQSTTVYQAWLDCIKKICGGRNTPYLDKAVAGKELTITLFWPNHNSTDKETITDITFGNLTPEPGGTLIKNKQIVGRNSYQKKFKIIDINAPSYVSVTISEFEPVLKFIEGVPKENLASNYPVGTIITSVLEWKRFCQINGQSENLNYSDKAHCKWAPADGRSVVGSTYGEVENLVPDLRGVFLRGVNDFGVAGVQPVGINQAETDIHNNRINRVANNFEGDDFRSHNHSISGPATVGNIVNGNNNFFNEPVGRQSGIQTNYSGGDETRPKNVTVYYYIKIN